MIFEKSANPRVSRVIFVFELGSRDDPKGKEGLVYFTAENMLRFEIDGKKLGTLIEQMGGELTVSVDRTHTTFELTILNESIGSAIQCLSEAWLRPVCSAEELEIVKQTTKGEIDAERQDPVWLARSGVLRSTYGDEISHPIGGSEQSVDQFDPGVVLDCFSNQLISAKAHFGFTSNDQKASAILQKLQDQLKPSQKTKAMSSPTINEKLAIVIHKKELSTFPFYLSTLGVADSDPDKIYLELANHAFGGDFTSRLSQELRVKQGWTYYTSSGFSQVLEPKNAPTYFSIHSAPREDVAIDAIKKALSMQNLWFERGLEESEFRSSQRALSFSYLFERDTAEKSVEWKLREAITGRKCLSLEEYRQKLQEFELKKINQRLTGFASQPYVLAVVGDESVLRKRLEKEFDFDRVETIDSSQLT